MISRRQIHRVSSHWVAVVECGSRSNRVRVRTAVAKREPAGRRRGRVVPGAAPNRQQWRPSLVVSKTAAKSEMSIVQGDSPERRLSSNPSSNGCNPTATPLSTDALVDELLATRRYALLLRPETKQHLTQLHVVRAIRQLDEAMALVPAGRVLLGQLAEQSNSACGPTDIDPKLAERNLVSVEPAYLDRFCVTNEEYQQFVDAGGYEQLEFWHEEALPALLDFVDQTGAPGPRYWSDGQYRERRAAAAGRRHQLVRSLGLCPLGRQATADRRRVDQSRRLAGRIGARPHRPAPLSVGRIVRRAPRAPVRLRPTADRWPSTNIPAARASAASIS